MTNGATRQRVLGYSSSSSTPSSIPSIVAEPDTTSVAFPAVNSQQRAPRAQRPTVVDAPPSLSLSPPDADSDQSGDELPDQQDHDEEEDDEDTFDLPSVRINGSGASSSSSARKQPRPAAAAAAAGLLPPPSTTKVVKAPKGRVRVEKGFSQLDWAKLNRSGEVDLRVSFRSLCPHGLSIEAVQLGGGWGVLLYASLRRYAMPGVWGEGVHSN